jgi:ribosomal protein S18 acetylase RimI-like enzyme
MAEGSERGSSRTGHAIEPRTLSADNVRLEPFALEHLPAVARLLEKLGWPRRVVDGQLTALNERHQGDAAFIAFKGSEVVGVVMVHYAAWNGLGQVHVLAVDGSHRHLGIGRMLVSACERFVASRAGRGIFADTPVGNRLARDFYAACGYSEAYIIPRYYPGDEDGVTFQKFLTGRSRGAAQLRA